jgi:drug/metabolite transporter (DMT)-like permease
VLGAEALMVGLLLALAAALTYAVGLTIEQRALRGLPRIGLRRFGRMVRVLATSPGWVAGFVIALGGLGLQIIALAYTQLSVAQPVFFTAQALLLMLFGRFLGDTPTRGQWAAVACMVASLAAISASVGPDGDVGQRAATPVVLIVTLGSVLAGLAAAAAAHLATRFSAAVGVIYGAAAGLLYGVAGMQAKGMSGLLARYHLRGVVPAVLASPYPYLLVLTCVLALGLFQTAMQRSRASVVAPVSNCVGNVYLVLAGSFVFAERLPAEPWRLGLRLLGFALAIAVLFLMPRGEENAAAEPARNTAGARRSRTG